MELNSELYKSDFHWKEGEFDVYRSTHWSAPGCHNGCGLLYYVKDNKVERVEGDPSCKWNRGRLCMRCLNQLEIMYSDERVTTPLKRAGERGENKWEEISWDEAYQMIEDFIRDEIDGAGLGRESIVGLVGTGRNVNWQLALTCYHAFGTPNLACGFLSGDSCMLPRMSGTLLTHGDCPVADLSQFSELRYDDPEYRFPEVCLIWGNNPIISNGDGFLGHWIVDAMRLGGTELIVVDPKLTWLASRAKIHLQLRPATDAALAMAMINVVISEKLYDNDFVEKWTFGFDELAERVAGCTPEWAAEICDLDADDIVAAARMWGAARPGALQWGLATDMHSNGIHEVHAIMCLNAICGNLDVPGGTRLARSEWNMELAYSSTWSLLPAEVRELRLGDNMSPMHKYGVSACAQADVMLNAIETSEPYPVKMLYLEGTNPIANMGAEAPRVYRAMMKCAFNVVLDYCITPTAAAVCDLFLPIAFSPERNSVREWWTPSRTSVQLTQYGDCKSDGQIAVDLLNRLNPTAAHELFNDPKTDVDICNWHIDRAPGKPEGMTFEKDVEAVNIWPHYEYRRYEKGLLRADGGLGFNTATGRIELWSTAFEQFGLDPLPKYEEPWEGPVSSPEKFAEYPIILTTGRRSWEFFHSEGRNQQTMREFHPDPIVEINPETAAEYGIEDGDWVWIENQRGRCRERACVTEQMKPGVINAEHGWWFPEQEGASPSFFGVFDSNINNLTTQMAFGETGYGAPYKGLLCKIYKCTSHNSDIMPGEQVVEHGGWDYEPLTMENHPF